MYKMKTSIHDELLTHATNRRPHYPGGVGAAFARDVTERDRDEARRWRFLVVDELGRWAYVDFVVTRVGYAENFNVEPIEEAVEHFISYRYAPEDRLASLVTETEQVDDPIGLPLDKRYRVRAPLA